MTAKEKVLKVCQDLWAGEIHEELEISHETWLQNAAESLPAQPEQGKLTDVFEVYGKSARSQGWDFMVCKTLKEALGVIESDLDELDADPDKEDELRIVFRRYTESQMEDVIYE